MRDLAGDDVDLVVQRDRDDHVGLLRAGRFQHVGMRAVADETADVERIAHRRGSDAGDVSIIDTSFFSAASRSAMPKPTCPAPQIMTRI